MKKLLLILALIALPVYMMGCGDSGGGIPAGGGTFVPDDGGAGGGSTDFDPTTSTIQTVTLAFGDGSTTTTLRADGTSSGALVRVTVLDQNGNAAPDQVVTFESFLGGTFSSNSITTGADGKGGVSYLPPTSLGQDLITARCGGVQSDPLTVNLVAGQPASAQFNIAPNAINPGGTTTLTASNIKDAAGHLLDGIQVSFFQFTNQSLGSLSAPTATTGTNGSASVSYTAGPNSGTDTFYIQAGAYSSPNATLTVSPAAVVVGSVTLTTADSTLVANGNNSTQITAEVRDVAGDPVSGIPVTFALATGSTSLGTVVTTTGTTLANGQAYARFDVGTNVGTATITATAAGFPRTVDITLVAGSPATLTLTAAPSPLFTGNSADVYANITDASNNAIAGETVTFELPIATNESGGSLSTTAATTDARGVAHITYTAGTQLGTDTIRAFAGVTPVVIDTFSLDVTPNQNAIATIAISAEPVAVQPAGGSTTFTVAALDINGSPVPGVTLTATATGSASATAGAAITDSFGLMDYTVTDANSENISVVITGGTARLVVPFTFGPTLTIVPSSLNVIGSGTMVAVLRDPNGSPIAGQDLFIIPTYLTADDQDNTVTSVGTTGIDGSVTLTVTDVQANGGSMTFVAQNGDGSITSNTGSVTFLTEASAFGLVASPVNPVIGTGLNATVVATVTDLTQGIPAAGQTVTVYVDGTQEATGTTDALGEFRATFTKTGNVLVDVYSGANKVSFQLYFDASVQLFPATADGIADGVTPTVLSAKVLDVNGNGIPNVPINFSLEPGTSATLDAYAEVNGVGLTGVEVTGENGTATVNVTDSVVEPVIVYASSGSSNRDSSSVVFAPSDPATIVLSSSLAANTDLSILGQTTITAHVTDVLGTLVADNTPVSFTTSLGSITPGSLTISGDATATLSAGNVAGPLTVTATAGGATATLSINVAAIEAGSIKFESAVPAFIHKDEASVVKFSVKDPIGNPAADGTSVTVSLDPNQLGGGELLSDGLNPYATSITTATINGNVTVTVLAGIISGTLDITASVDTTLAADPISTVGQVTIISGAADNRHIGISTDVKNLPGFEYLGCQGNLTLLVADRYGNPVDDGTKVSFIVEPGCGAIGSADSFETTTQSGQVVNVPFYTNYNGFWSQQPLCTVVAYTPGDESFDDLDGNGIWDTGEPCYRQPEPFVDADDNGTYTPGELYVDANNDGSWNNWSAAADCKTDTLVWTDINFLFSGELQDPPLAPPGLSISPNTFTIAAGASQGFTVTVQDVNGNSPIAGSTIVISSTGGKLGGTTTLVVPDRETEGAVTFNFTLASDAVATPTDVTLKATFSPPGSTNCKNNGVTPQPVSISGSIGN